MSQMVTMAEQNFMATPNGISYEAQIPRIRDFAAEHNLVQDKSIYTADPKVLYLQKMLCEDD
jgi:hypothetical protein